MNNDNFLISVPIQMKMCDLDPFVHINNGAQCGYFDYGRTCYFEKVFNYGIEWDKMDIVIARIELDFLKNIEIHDSIFCKTKIYEVGNKSFKMLQQLFDEKTNTVKTICHSVMVNINRETKESVLLKQVYRDKIYEFENLK